MSPARYVITETAVADLHEIWEYIADDSPDVADRVFQELLNECERLASDPGIGHTREDLIPKRPVKFWTL
jgi:plasmid stabilization system protein ParE